MFDPEFIYFRLKKKKMDPQSSGIASRQGLKEALRGTWRIRWRGNVKING